MIYPTQLPTSYVVYVLILRGAFTKLPNSNYISFFFLVSLFISSMHQFNFTFFSHGNKDMFYVLLLFFNIVSQSSCFLLLQNSQTQIYISFFFLISLFISSMHQFNFTFFSHGNKDMFYFLLLFFNIVSQSSWFFFSLQEHGYTLRFWFYAI